MSDDGSIGTEVFKFSRDEQNTNPRRIYEEVFPLLRAGRRVIIEADPDHPGVSAFCGCVCSASPSLSLRWNDQVWATTMLWETVDVKYPHMEPYMASVICEGGDPEGNFQAIWFDTLGTLPEPDLSALAAASGERIRSMFKFVNGKNLDGVDPYLAVSVLIEAMEAKWFKGWRVVVCLSATPDVAYLIGTLFHGCGRYPDVKFVEKAPQDDTLKLAATR
jgi:hypothetical protein